MQWPRLVLLGTLSLSVPHSLRQASRFRTLPITLPFSGVSGPFLLGSRHFYFKISMLSINYASFIYRIVDCLPKYNMGYFLKPVLPAYSEAIGESVPIPSYALPRRKRRPYSGTGYEDGQYPFVPYNPTTARFCDIKQRRNCSFLTSSSIAITSLTIRSSEVTGRVFLMSS